MCELKVKVIECNTYHTSKAEMDQVQFIESIRRKFPRTFVAEGDQLLAEAERAEQFMREESSDGELTGTQEEVLRSLRRKAENFGPVFMFFFARPHGFYVSVSVSRYGGSFRVPEPFSAEEIEGYCDLLRVMNVGEPRVREVEY